MSPSSSFRSITHCSQRSSNSLWYQPISPQRRSHPLHHDILLSLKKWTLGMGPRWIHPTQPQRELDPMACLFLPLFLCSAGSFGWRAGIVIVTLHVARGGMDLRPPRVIRALRKPWTLTRSSGQDNATTRLIYMIRGLSV